MHIIEAEEWWSDTWAGDDYAIDYHDAIDPLQTISSLILSVPHMSLVVQGNEKLKIYKTMLDGTKIVIYVFAQIILRGAYTVRIYITVPTVLTVLRVRSYRDAMNVLIAETALSCSAQLTAATVQILNI